MKCSLLMAALVVVVLPGRASAEFYVWHDAHGVKQISNVPPRCIRHGTVLPACLTRMGPLADPHHVSTLNEQRFETLLRQDREQRRQRKIEQSRKKAAAAAAAKAVGSETRALDSKRIELSKQLHAAEDEAQMKFLHGHDVPGPLLDRIDRLRAQLKALEAGTHAGGS